MKREEHEEGGGFHSKGGMQAFREERMTESHSKRRNHCYTSFPNANFPFPVPMAGRSS
jgi:hypothetical protein